MEFITFNPRLLRPSHHGMACPWVVDGGDGVQMLMAVAVNVLNKQSRTAKRSGPPSWRLGKELKPPDCANSSS
jgi:hypothetical protein